MAISTIVSAVTEQATWTVMGSLVVAYLLHVVVISYLRRRAVFGAPLVSGDVPVFGHVLRIPQPNPLVGFRAWHKQYGPQYQLWYFNRPVLMVSDRSLVREVLVTNQAAYVRGDEFESDRRMFGDVLFAVDGPAWHKRRKLLNPVFRSKTLEPAVVPYLTAVAWPRLKQRLLNAGPHAVVEMDEPFVLLTADVICKFVLGEDINNLEGDDPIGLAAFFKTVASEFMSRTAMGDKLYDVLPTPPRIKFLLADRKLRGHLVQYIRRRRAQLSNNTGDVPVDSSATGVEFLSVMAQDSASEQAICDEIIGFLFAGHDTTAHTLAFCLYHLSCNPDMQQRLRAEFQEQRSQHAHLSEEAFMTSGAWIGRLAFAEACITETLRMYTISILHPVKTVKPCQLGPYTLPQNAAVWVNLDQVHRDPIAWPEPHVFRPERHLNPSQRRVVTEDLDGLGGDRCDRGVDTRVSDERHDANTTAGPDDTKKFQYWLPFLEGKHSCIGRHLARLEIAFLLSVICSDFEVSCAPGYEPVAGVQITLRPIGGVHLSFKPR